MTESGEGSTQTPGHRQGTQPADEWLSTTQFATELGVTTAHLTQWLAEGEQIPHYQFGPHEVRFRRSEIESLLRETSALPRGNEVTILAPARDHTDS